MRSILILTKILMCVFAYCLGSVNFAVVFSRIKNTNIKLVGSKNPGTMNVLRTVGKFWGAMTFVCDALKGILMAVIGMYLASDGGMTWALILGAITVIGHVFPMYSRFRGGKGVATSIGVFLVVEPIVAVIVLACLIALLFMTKYGFIGSLVSITALSVFACVRYYTEPLVIVCAVVICLLVFFAHRSNIIGMARGNAVTLDLTKKPQSVADDEHENTEEASADAREEPSEDRQ